MKNYRKLRNVAVSLVLGSTAVQLNAMGLQNRWVPDILQPGAEEYLPDYSYAGYHNGEKPLPRLKPTVRVTDFGARADDGLDDTDAIKKAIAQAASLEGSQVVGFPKGRFIVSDILFLEQSGLVLQGVGSGEDGTVLYFPKPLAEMPQPPEIKQLVVYLEKNNKRMGDEFFSPYSWTGGLIWAHEANLDPQQVAEVTGGTRGQHTITVKDSTNVKPGMTLRVLWFNRDGPEGSLLQHMYMSSHPGCGSRLYENPDEPIIKQPVQVLAVNGKTITIKEPLLHDLKPEWTPLLERFAPIQEVGIEQLRIEFPPAKYRGHHLEAGYNAIYMTGVRNSWVRDVVVVHGDSGFISGDISLITVQDICIEGRGGHYTLHLSGYGVLVRDFVCTATALHNPSVNTGCACGVYTHGKIASPILDQHSGGNHQNLFDDLELSGVSSNLFENSGAKYWMPAAGAYNTFWNLSVKNRLDTHDKATLGGLGARAWHGRLIGIHGDKEINLDYDPSAYIEGTNRKDLAVPSLYEYQLRKRLDK
ncbi:MAG: glycosyl hydrolase family 28-related protein [Verrucomicrobiota bacterium]|nr:glycosyl hydrolase family 28-related protein [Verrucomicrobiota bacterium]